ncbi:DUF397 domain-containing protein [Actinomadura craniellae]|uniref:DUF397 domain-containing protein n=1 Tax=Actinomadura craniellae TaxID=2231787 RepID=A0A365H961_9ACTN|nr:DUF397 domain-containing protein [Actinomadura craniellae]RAY14803.1 DUF397 domain-containing protein [Actinomadura craniellae]
MSESAHWRKSTRSGTQQGNCVEVANLNGTIGIRDSKNPNAGHLTLTPNTFHTLLNRIRSDEKAR